MTESQKERVHAQTQQMYSEAIVINAMEEMAELIQALCKTLRLMLGYKTLRKTEKEVSAMVDEEIADTEIALNMLVDIMGYQGQRKHVESVRRVEPFMLWLRDQKGVLCESETEDAYEYWHPASVKGRRKMMDKVELH